MISIYLGPILSLLFINDGTQIVSTSADGNLSLIDVHSAKIINKFEN